MKNADNSARRGGKSMDLISINATDVVQLAQQALLSSSAKSTKTVRDLARSLRQQHPETALALTKLLRTETSRGITPATETPLDLDSRMPLIRVEDPAFPDRELVLSPNTAELINQLIAERVHPELLINAGLAPSSTALFVGPPGVGKTTAARKVANGLGLPLLVLDLSSDISSFPWAKQDPTSAGYSTTRECVASRALARVNSTSLPRVEATRQELASSNDSLRSCSKKWMTGPRTHYSLRQPITQNPLTPLFGDALT